MCKEIVKVMYNFSLLFDVTNGNPNGDPDMGGRPRVDPISGLGQVSPEALKRAIRDYTTLAREGEDGYRIFITKDIPLELQQKEGVDAVDKSTKASPEEIIKLRKNHMCKTFFDVRSFGAVMSTTNDCGKVRGPVQIGMANSIHPVSPVEMGLTRVVRTKAADTKKQEMGSRYYIPYALYRADGYISATDAANTGFNEEDLDLLFEALSNMFEHNRSTMKGSMTSRRLVVWKHSSRLGNAHAHKLFSSLKVSSKVAQPLSYDDYEFDLAAAPAGVEVKELL